MKKGLLLISFTHNLLAINVHSFFPLNAIELISDGERMIHHKSIQKPIKTAVWNTILFIDAKLRTPTSMPTIS